MTFRIPVDENAVDKPFLDFEQFRVRFANDPPADRIPHYSRKGGGYLGVYSLELMAADCDAIVRGVIENSCFVAGTPDGVTSDSYVVKVRMIEAFKGNVPEQFACFITDAADLQALERDKQELVLFLRSNVNQGLAYPMGAVEYRTRAQIWNDSVIVLDDESAEVLYSDMTWH